MDPQQAIGILIQVANLAQSRGALNLKDAVIVNQAIEVLTNKPSEQPSTLMDKVVNEVPEKQPAQK